MTDYNKLVKALRDCASGDGERCHKCTYNKVSNMPCDNALMSDAAAAIEALQAELIRIYKQLPKRCEWIWDDKRCIYVCSVCGSPKVRENMDRQIIKEQSYCYSCGAKWTRLTRI